jgi:hypothetical protein
MKSIFLSLFVAVFFIGCAAAPPKISNTKTGKPEIVIHKPAKFIKPHLISDALDRGYMLKKDSDYLIEFSRKPKNTGERLTAGMLVGNSHSSNTIELQYTLVESAGKTRVIAHSYVQAIMPFGKINKMDNNGSGTFNEIQGFFNDLKARLQ